MTNEQFEDLISAIGCFERAITPRGSGNTFITGGNDATGGYVTSLTEAMMGVTAGLCKIADAIDRYTDTINPTSDPTNG